MILNKTDIYFAKSVFCVLLTFGPRTFHEVLVRIVYGAEKKQRPDRGWLDPMSSLAPISLGCSVAYLLRNTQR